MDPLSAAVWAAAAVALAAALWAVARRIAREQQEDEVRRLVELERSRGPADPEVRRLRVRVWRYLLHYPDPIPWGRYRWKGGRVDAQSQNG